jgi:Flp pilus assembly protein TadD
MLQDSDPKRALSMLSQAYRLAPHSANVADTLGWAKLQQKDAAGGLNLLNQAHTLDPRDGEITYHLVRALDANGKRNDARGLLKSLLASGAQFKDRPAATQLANNWH